MTNLSIKDVPESWAEGLRQRAARNHRSLQGELMAIIEAALRQEAAAPAPAGLGSFRRGTKTIEQIVEARRGLYPEPMRDVPLAVDIIRADRDSR